MKWGYFVLLAFGIVTIIATGFGLWYWTSKAKPAEVRRPVPAPDVRTIVVLNLPGFRVIWKPVQAEDIVLGYKLKVYEIKGELNQYKYIHKSRHYKKGKFEYYEETWEPQINKTSKIGPTVIDVKGVNTTEAVFGIAKQDVWYDLRVVAYTESDESEETGHNFIKIPSSKSAAGNDSATTPPDARRRRVPPKNMLKSKLTANDSNGTNTTEAGIGVAKQNILDLRKLASTKSNKSEESGTNMLKILSPKNEAAENDTTTTPNNADTTATPTIADTTTDNEFITIRGI